MWIAEDEEIVRSFEDFYNNLFKEEENDRIWVDTKQKWGKIEVSRPKGVSVDVREEEISRAFFQIGAFKAPGNDGYPAVFY